MVVTTTPKPLSTRPLVDAVEERRIREPAGARHTPADRIRRAKVVARSWDGTPGAGHCRSAGV
jgi:hypothetical protein